MAKLVRIGAISVLVLIVLIAITIVFELQETFILQNPNLNLILNLLFLTGTSLAVTVISANSFLKNGHINVLLLSNALLVSGLVALIAGLVGFISANYNNTIYNTGICVSAGLQLVSAIVTIKGTKFLFSMNQRTLLSLSFVCSLLFVIVLTAFTLQGLVPASSKTIARARI